MHILVIEDDEMYAELVRLALKRAGLEVTLVDNAIDGLVLAEELRPDAIVMDVALPRMDGLEAVAVLRSNPELAHIPIVVATASGTTHTRHEAKQVGADIFLEKPFPLSQLVEILQNL